LVNKIVIQQDEFKNIDHEYHITPINDEKEISIYLHCNARYGFSGNLKIIVNEPFGVKKFTH
jgi:hypothetical protein